MTLIINPSFNLITVLWLFETHYVFVCVGGGFLSDVHENIMWFVSKTEALCVGADMFLFILYTAILEI